MSLETTRESALLCSIQTPDDFYLAKASGITPQHFLGEGYGYRDIWMFFERYITDHGQVPPLPLIQQNYSAFVPVAHGTVEYEASQLHQVYLTRAVQGILTDNIDSIASNPVSALNSIIDGLQGIKVSLNDRIGYMNDNDVAASVRARFLSSGGGDEEDQFSGIPTGIEVLDIMKRGWQPNELISVVARPGIGKTALLIRFGVEAWDNGYRVLFVSPEMSKEEILLRSDVMIAHKHGLQNFPTNWQLSTGKMSSSKLETYERYRREQTDDRWLTLEMNADSDAFTINYVLSQARQHRADLVIVDNIGYIDDDKKSSSAWESMRNVVREAKKYASTRDTPIIVAQHAKQGAVKKLWDMPEMSDVYMGDALAQYSDRLIAMAVSRNSQAHRHMMLWKNRGDMTFTRKKEISFDINKGDIGRWVEPDAQKAKSELGHLFLDLPEGAEFGHSAYDAYEDESDGSYEDGESSLSEFSL